MDERVLLQLLQRRNDEHAALPHGQRRGPRKGK